MNFMVLGQNLTGVNHLEQLFKAKSVVFREVHRLFAKPALLAVFGGIPVFGRNSRLFSTFSGIP